MTELNQTKAQSLELTIGTADFSFDEAMAYRYRLTRTWDADRAVVNFIGLNPSTADALASDPTIRRCVGFARRWGFGKLVMTNLFALRSTDPGALCFAGDPVGPENDRWIMEAADEATLIIGAWGAVGGLMRNSAPFAVRRAIMVCRLIRKPIHALAFTKMGEPRHPLYLRGDLLPRPFLHTSDNEV